MNLSSFTLNMITCKSVEFLRKYRVKIVEKRFFEITDTKFFSIKVSQFHNPTLRPKFYDFPNRPTLGHF